MNSDPASALMDDLANDLEKAGFTVKKSRKRKQKTSLVDKSAVAPALRADTTVSPALVAAPQALVAAPQVNEVVSPADELARLHAIGENLTAQLAKARDDLVKLEKFIQVTSKQLAINNSKVTTARQELELCELENEKPVAASAPAAAKSFSSVASQLSSSNESSKGIHDTPKQPTKEARGLSLKNIVEKMKNAGGRPYSKDPHALEYILSDIAPEDLCNDTHATRNFIETLSKGRLPQDTLTQICTFVSKNHFTERPFIKLMAWNDYLSGSYTVTMLVFPRQ